MEQDQVSKEIPGECPSGRASDGLQPGLASSPDDSASTGKRPTRAAGQLASSAAPRRESKPNKGTRDPDEAELREMLSVYVENRGAIKPTAAHFKITPRRMRRIVEDFKFDQSLEESREQVRKRVTMSVSESNAQVIDGFINPYLGRQVAILAEKLENGEITNLDIGALERLTKLRDDLQSTGGAGSLNTVERIAAAIDALDPDQKRELVDVLTRPRQR